jgi:hypothetical protein
LDAQRAAVGGEIQKAPAKKDKEAQQPWKPQIPDQQQQQEQVEAQYRKNQREQQEALQKQLQQQQRQLQQLQLQQQQQQQLLQQEQQKQMQERQQMQFLQQQQLLQQQQQKQAKERLEPMFIQSSVDQITPGQNWQTPPGLLAMQQATASMGYPLDNSTGVPPGLSAPPGFCQPSYNYNQGSGYENLYHPGLASIPAQHVPDTAELNKVEALSKHIKSLRKQVRKLQDTMNTAQRSDSDQSTLSGAINTVSDSSSNDDFVTTKSSSDAESRQVGSNLAMGNNYRHQAQALRFAENKLVGA